MDHIHNNPDLYIRIIGYKQYHNDKKQRNQAFKERHQEDQKSPEKGRDGCIRGYARVSGSILG